MSDRATKRRWDEAEADGDDSKVSLDPAAQAAAIAAKIAATMGGSRPPGAREDRKDTPSQHDAAFTHDIEINDLRNRYLLTKGATQAQIGAETGASIVTKGIWLPDKSKATAQEPPLYLHIAASSQEQLDKAVGKVNELINQELGPLVEDRSQYARNRERYLAESAAPRERRKWPEAKVPINLESLRNFNVRAKVVGPGGMFVKYIQAETGTRVQIKGLGSGFYENDTGRESEEPMHINVTGPDEAMIERGKELAEDLLEVVRQEHDKARAALFGGGGGGGGGGGYQQGGYGGQQGGYQGMYGAQAGYAGYPGYAQPAVSTDIQSGTTPAAGSAASATPATTGVVPGGTPSGGDAGAAAGGAAPAGGSTDPNAAAAYQQYRDYWAAYGYNVDDPAFQQWQASQTQAQQHAGQQGGAGAPVADGAGSNVAPAPAPATATATAAQSDGTPAT